MNNETRNFVGYGANPPHPQWPGNAKLALQFVLNLEEGAERCILNGDNCSETYLQEIPARQPRTNKRDKSVESFYEYGSRAGFWRILRIFAKYQLPLTAFAAGQSLELNPDAGYALAEAGHEIAGHGYRWINYHDVSISEEQEHIQHTINIIKKISGKSPVGWYTGRCSENTRELLLQQGGFLYDSDAYNDDLPYWYSHKPSHLIIPYTLVNNDFRYLSGSGMATSELFYQSLCAAFNVLMAEGKEKPKLMSVGLHSRISGHPARADALIRFLDYVTSHEQVWICRREEIAEHWQHII
ncbi:MAG: polysaccharide deacetylase family protein [Gammaproteobacteria bacterium]|nr:polysaccharide deacetylase family protein [Gammaproteobacteria bacterium]